MRSHRSVLLLAGLLLGSLPSFAQGQITIPAGTPEDQALVAITRESDAQKKAAMLQEYVQKFASNPDAVAYGNWQLAQMAMKAGDPAQALEYGDKALAAMPDLVDILTLQVEAAQQMKDSAKVADYALRGGAIINSIGKQPKPESTSAQDWKTQLASKRAAAQQTYDYFEAAAFNAIAGEQDAQQRMTLIERYTAAFPKSKYGEQITTLAIITLEQKQDWTRLASFAEKAVAADPDDVTLQAAVAAALVRDPKGTYLREAAAYARKAIALAKADSEDPQVRKTAGVAHSALGYVLLREGKYAAALRDLRAAVTMLKDSPQDLQEALYRLGFACVKTERAIEAMRVLTQASKMEGPYQEMARDLLAKIKAARRY
jgi:tetratricopeptide (TPR) repeat protein